ncbi:uncharacterized protein LOC141627063 [Silene latifolia]|uniref:uncharacterized protein LOC141627063 n=1 Tax=Silene latifolia TaxID=37657 RepID=UPI003D778DBD
MRNGTDTLCPICNSSEESSFHLIREYGWVGWVWDGVGLEVKKGDGFERVREWVEEEWREWSVRECLTFMTGCWAIWGARNKWVFEGKTVNPEVVVRRIRGLLREMLEEQGVEEESSGGNGSSGGAREGGWVKPVGGEFKINVDAGVVGGVGTGVGAVCRDGEGYLVWALTEQETIEREPAEAEALAILAGVREAQRRGMRRIVVEGDCITVIQDLQKRRQGRSNIFMIYEEIFDVCTHFESCVFSFTRRNFNSVAHSLAHIDPWLSGCRRWDENVPQHISDCIARDRLSMK